MDSDRIHHATRVAYNKIADKYHELFKNELQEKPFDRAFIDQFLQGLDKESLLYDAGCGPCGHITKYIAEKGYRIKGIDISERCIEIASKENPQIEFECVDFLNWQVKDSSVAAIISFYSIIYTPKKEVYKILQVFRQALQAKGKLLIVLKKGRFEGYVDKILGVNVKAYFCEYELQEIKQLMEENGFTIQSCYTRIPYEGEIQNERIYLTCLKR